VIVRISSTGVSESRVRAYREFLESSVIPRYETSPGMVRVSLLERQLVAYVEMLTVSLWQSREQLQQFLENLQLSMESQKLVEDAKRKYGVIEVESRTFEVVLSREANQQNH
jgi:heme-degrading monooxygenase HmoA